MSKIADNAIYSWWTNAIATKNGDLFFCGIDSSGNQKVFKNTDSTSFTLGSTNPDDHNSPSIVVQDGKPSIAFYTAHGSSPYVKYRVEDNEGDIDFGAEQTIDFTDNVTYSQTLVKEDRIVLITRSPAGKWKYAVSEDWGDTWSTPAVLLDATAEGKVYLTIKQSEFNPDIYHLACYGHPTESTWHDIIYGQINIETGDVSKRSGVVANIFSGDDLPLSKTSLDTVFSPTGENKTRLLEVGDKLGRPIIYFAKWISTGVADYYTACRDKNGAWEISLFGTSGATFNNGNGRKYVGGLALRKGAREVVACWYNSSASRWKVTSYDLDLRNMPFAPVELDSNLNPLARPISVNDGSIIYQKLIDYTDINDYESELYLV